MIATSPGAPICNVPIFGARSMILAPGTIKFGWPAALHRPFGALERFDAVPKDDIFRHPHLHPDQKIGVHSDAATTMDFVSPASSISRTMFSIYLTATTRRRRICHASRGGRR
jgi:hypothetical protein